MQTALKWLLAASFQFRTFQTPIFQNRNRNEQWAKNCSWTIKTKKSRRRKSSNSLNTRSKHQQGPFKAVKRKSPTVKSHLSLTKSVIWNQCYKQKGLLRTIVDRGKAWVSAEPVEATEHQFRSQLLVLLQWTFRIRDSGKTQGVESTPRTCQEDLWNDHHQPAVRTQGAWNLLEKERFPNRKH